MMGAQVFLTKPRRANADTSDLGRYSRLEHGTSDPAWIVSDRRQPEGWEALERWLRGDDDALEEWLGGPGPARERRARTTV